MTETIKATVQQVLEELVQDSLTAGASPRPKDAGEAGALTTASSSLAGFASALYHLNQVAPDRAADVVEWWTDGGRDDAEEFGMWAMGTIARHPEDFIQWQANARKAAEEAAAATSTRTPLSGNAHPLAVTEELPAETTQPSGDWEDCDACSENQDMCRYHRGIIAGYAVLREAATETPDLTVAELLASLDSGE